MAYGWAAVCCVQYSGMQVSGLVLCCLCESLILPPYSVETDFYSLGNLKSSGIEST